MNPFQHPTFNRRVALQAGALGLLNLGLGELNTLRAASDRKHRSVIIVFLSGGLGQHDSFDLKPNATETIRGEFKPIATKTPGTQICEHLPKLADRSERWSLVRSLTHPSNAHSNGHHIMLTGRSEVPRGFDPNGPKPTDHPSIASIITATCPPRNNLPPAIVLPDRIVHNTGRVIPGQFAGVMGSARDPWFMEASPFEPKAYGAYPEYEFDHQERPYAFKRNKFVIPNLTLPQEVDPLRMGSRESILASLDKQRKSLDTASEGLGHSRERAMAILMDAKVRKAFDIAHAPKKDLETYGANAFGWSLLMAARLVESGVNLVQVNLGNNETWDTHGNAFPHLKDKLFPPTDKALSALIDDLHDRGLLDSTLIAVFGEFGRTPRVFGLEKFYKKPGRDHWGGVQSVLLAGGGIHGGRVIGSSDKNGAYPATDPQTPENLAATIYNSLGLPKTTAWKDSENRPHYIYHGEPIAGLL